ncbi:MAG: ATPase, T2SS/T4P/T4SS family, partial [Sulfolobaceae archaeon]
MKPKYLVEILRHICSIKASDLHITVGSPPRARVNGDLTNLEYDTLLPSDTRDLCYSVMNELNRKRFEENFDVDFSFGVADLARFRANVFMQRGSIAGVFRIIPQEIPDFNTLGLPPIVKEFSNLPKGLVLVTGPTGSGKSTTLASILNLINKTRPVHIITLEDPIEFTYKHDKALVNQREVGTDASSFAQGLKHIMRQDPDVILIGEMRDAETI